MADPVARHRPPIYPPPQFPPRRPKLFARTPPAVFGVILGLIGLQIAVRGICARLGVGAALPDLLLGMVAGLWGFALLAYLAKLARRPSALLDDLAIDPGRAGLSSASMGMMALGGSLGPVAPGAGMAMVQIGLALHASVALLALRALLRTPREGRGVTPVTHMVFSGFGVGGMAAAMLGVPGFAMTVLWLALPVAAAIWAVSLWQLLTRIPPAPLRPLLAIHLAPAATAALTAALSGEAVLAQVMMAVSAVMVVAMVLALRWIMAAPFTPLWVAVCYPLTITAAAMLTLGGRWTVPGLVLGGMAALAVPMLAWRVLKLWPGNRLAVLTNASEA